MTWTDENQNRAILNLPETRDSPAPRLTVSAAPPERPWTALEPLLTRIAALGWKVKVIEVANAKGDYVWWADLYHPGRVGRKHGYGPSMLEALSAAQRAEEVTHDVPTFTPQHKVAEYREAQKSEGSFVRRF